MQDAAFTNAPEGVAHGFVEPLRVEGSSRSVGFEQQSCGTEIDQGINSRPLRDDHTPPLQSLHVEKGRCLSNLPDDSSAGAVDYALSLDNSGGRTFPMAVSSTPASSFSKMEDSGEETLQRDRSPGEATPESQLSPAEQLSDQLDYASLFISPLDDLDSWGGSSDALPLPASSFVVTEAISPLEGQSSFAGIATFLFSLFQGDVRFGILSAQGRLMAWRSLLFLAEHHDRRVSSNARNAQSSPVSMAASTNSGFESSVSVRRRRLQRDCVATSRGKRSVRHAFLLDRNAGPSPSSGGTKTALGCCGDTATPTIVRGVVDDCDEEEVPSVAGPPYREDAGEGAAVTSSGSTGAALSAETLSFTVKGYLEDNGVAALLHRKKLVDLATERVFPRYVGGTIDRRWALQQKTVKIAPASPEKSSGKNHAVLPLLLEEYPLQPAMKMWPHANLLPEKIFVGLPIQVARWVCCGRPHGSEASGRMLWQDYVVESEVSDGVFFAVPRSAGDRIEGGGTPQRMQLRVAAFAPPRLPTPSPAEGSWRLSPRSVDVSRDIYPGACLSVGLLVNTPSSKAGEAGASQGGSRCFFVDVVVQRIFFSLEEANQAKASALAEGSRIDRHLQDCNGRSDSPFSNSGLNYAGGGGGEHSASANGLWGLRPNVPVKAMRVMVLRSGGAEQEFANVDGRKIYKLEFDLVAKTPQPSQSLSWVVPRALCPCVLSTLSAFRRSGKKDSTQKTTLECLSSFGWARASRWNLPTMERGEEWLDFPPFVLAFLPYDQTAVYARSHPALLAFLTPELDAAAVARGEWKLRLPQCLPLRSSPCVVPHPSDSVSDSRFAPSLATREGIGSPPDGAVFFTSAQSSAATSDFLRSAKAGVGGSSECLRGKRGLDPPLPIRVAGSQTSSGDGAGRTSSVLAMNHLANLLCSSSGASTDQVISKALPFFRYLLSHQSSKWREESPAGDATAIAAAAALKAADRTAAAFLNQEEESTLDKRISFSPAVPSAARLAEGEEFRRRLESGEHEPPTVWREEESGGGSFSSESATVRCPPNSQHISGFLLRTSGYNAPFSNQQAEEASGSGRFAADCKGQHNPPACGETACEMFDISDDEASTSRRAGTASFRISELDKAFKRFESGMRSSHLGNEQPVISRDSAATTPPAVFEGGMGFSPVGFNEDSQHLSPSHENPVSTECGGGSLRRTRQQSSISSPSEVEGNRIGGFEETGGTELNGCFVSRPAKKAMRRVAAACDQVETTWDLAALQTRSDKLQRREGETDLRSAERGLGESSLPSEAPPGAGSERWNEVEVSRNCSSRDRPGEQIFAAEKLHEALKGFLRSIREGSTPASAMLSVPASTSPSLTEGNKGFLT